MAPDLKSSIGFMNQGGTRYEICRTHLFDTHASSRYHFEAEWLEKFKNVPGIN